MKVITAYPVIHQVNRKTVRKVCANPEFLSLDASSSTSNVQAFQDWLDVKHPTWYKGGRLNKQSGYGTFGPSTTSAYSQYGAEFDAGANNITNAINNSSMLTSSSAAPSSSTSGAPSSSASVPANASLTDPSGNTKSGHFWDKLKGAFVKAKDSGILDKLKAKLSGGSSSGQSGAASGSSDMGSSYTPDTTTTGMSKGKKIALIAGGAVILGIIIFVAVKNSKKSK